MSWRAVHRHSAATECFLRVERLNLTTLVHHRKPYRPSVRSATAPPLPAADLRAAAAPSRRASNVLKTSSPSPSPTALRSTFSVISCPMVSSFSSMSTGAFRLLARLVVAVRRQRYPQSRCSGRARPSPSFPIPAETPPKVRARPRPGRRPVSGGGLRPVLRSLARWRRNGIVTLRAV